MSDLPQPTTVGEMPENRTMSCPNCGHIQNGVGEVPSVGGDPVFWCPQCGSLQRPAVDELLVPVRDEKRRRIYYQNIVYYVCRELDRAFGKRAHRGEGVVCGTLETPSTEVQELMTELADRSLARSEEWARNQTGSQPQTRDARPTSVAESERLRRQNNELGPIS